MSKHRTNAEKKARRRAKELAALPPVPKQPQTVPYEYSGFTAPVDTRNPATVLHNLTHPDDLQQVPYTVQPAKLAPGSLETLAEQLRKPKHKRDISVTDAIILKNGNAFVPFSEIAALPGIDLSPQEVRARYMELLQDENTYSTAEMRLVATQQLKSVINMVQNLAAQGSGEHLKILLDALGQMQRMYDLWSSKVTDEQNILTGQQALMIIGMASAMGTAFREALEEKQIHVLPEIVDEATERALELSAARIEAAMAQTVQV